MPTGTQDGRKRLYLDFDGYFAAVEEQAASARRVVRMRMPRRDVVAAAGTGEKDGLRAFQVLAIGLTIGVPAGEDGSTFATMADASACTWTSTGTSPRWRSKGFGVGAASGAHENAAPAHCVTWWLRRVPARKTVYGRSRCSQSA